MHALRQVYQLRRHLKSEPHKALVFRKLLDIIVHRMGRDHIDAKKNRQMIVSERATVTRTHVEKKESGSEEDEKAE